MTRAGAYFMAVRLFVRAVRKGRVASDGTTLVWGASELIDSEGALRAMSVRVELQTKAPGRGPRRAGA